MSNDTNTKAGFNKGENNAGGGGKSGGGGKNNPSDHNLEKGDLKREDNVQDFDKLNAKPGKNSKLLEEKRD